MMQRPDNATEDRVLQLTPTGGYRVRQLYQFADSPKPIEVWADYLPTDIRALVRAYNEKPSAVLSRQLISPTWERNRQLVTTVSALWLEDPNQDGEFCLMGLLDSPPPTDFQELWQVRLTQTEGMVISDVRLLEIEPVRRRK